MRKIAGFKIERNLVLHLTAEQFHQLDLVQSCVSSQFQWELLTIHSIVYGHMRTCTACK